MTVNQGVLGSSPRGGAKSHRMMAFLLVTNSMISNWGMMNEHLTVNHPEASGLVQAQEEEQKATERCFFSLATKFNRYEQFLCLHSLFRVFGQILCWSDWRPASPNSISQQSHRVKKIHCEGNSVELKDLACVRIERSCTETWKLYQENQEQKIHRAAHQWFSVTERHRKTNEHLTVNHPDASGDASGLVQAQEESLKVR